MTPYTLNAPITMTELELRELCLPIVMKHFSKYRGKEQNTAAIYQCTDQLVETLCKKLSTPSQSDQV